MCGWLLLPFSYTLPSQTAAVSDASEVGNRGVGEWEGRKERRQGSSYWTDIILN